MRKFFGVVLIIFGSLIALGSVFPLLEMFSKISSSEPNFEYNSAFLFGSLIAFGMTGLIAYLIIYAGRKLYKYKKVVMGDSSSK